MFQIYSDIFRHPKYFDSGRFGSGSLNTKVLNQFGYQTNFGLGSALYVLIRIGSVLRIQIFC